MTTIPGVVGFVFGAPELKLFYAGTLTILASSRQRDSSNIRHT